MKTTQTIDNLEVFKRIKILSDRKCSYTNKPLPSCNSKPEIAYPRKVRATMKIAELQCEKPKRLYK